MIRVGTAGWAIPRAVADAFPGEGTGLERYAARFDAVEINTSFYRPHKRATWERWAASVPPHFRFAVKLPKAITHEAKLIDCDDALARFADEVGGLGGKHAVTLVQLPGKFDFAAGVVDAFFAALRRIVPGAIACEPRNPGWFTPDADALLAAHGVARVAADPAKVPAAALPGGDRGFSYWRFHGSPRIYWSRYDEAMVAAQAAAARDGDWVIYDNTGSGAAAANALEFGALLGRRCAA